MRNSWFSLQLCKLRTAHNRSVINPQSRKRVRVWIPRVSPQTIWSTSSHSFTLPLWIPAFIPSPPTSNVAKRSRACSTDKPTKRHSARAGEIHECKSNRFALFSFPNKTTQKLDRPTRNPFQKFMKSFKVIGQGQLRSVFFNHPVFLLYVAVATTALPDIPRCLIF